MIVVSKVSSVQPSGTADRPRRLLGGNAGGLRRASEFSEVLQKGARFTGERMVVYIMPRDQGLRVGFVIGRKVGGAVQRNRARRRLKEAWRALAGRLRDGYDVVVVARPEIRGAKTQDLTPEVERLLRTILVMRP